MFRLRPVLIWLLLALFVGGLASSAVASAVGIPSVSLDIQPAGDGEQLSTTLQLLALLTILSIAPAILILTTAFTRIVIVLSFVRTALGTQAIPPNQVIVGLSLFLTFFVMGPTYQQIYDEAVKPMMATENPIGFEEALARATPPMRNFMLQHTYESDLMMFLDARGERPETREDVSLLALIPAFVISELKTAFIIGFYIFVPFVIIDLIVASVLMAMGMMMMPPIVVSLPAKVLVFILADGWSVLITALLAGYV